MLENFKINGTQLKLIAIITMLIDHIAAIILEQNTEIYTQNIFIYDTMRAIGRLSFPIFCFLSVQGFIYTKNIKKYILRLFLFALLTEIPFDLAFFGSCFYMEYNNVLWSILLGIVMLSIMRKYENNILISMGALIAACALGIYLKVDYLYIAPLLMSLLYKMRYNRKKQMVAGMFLMFYVYFQSNLVQAIVAMMSFVLLFCYDGTRGKGMKYFFYVFYPMHLLVLYFIRKVMYV